MTQERAYEQEIIQKNRTLETIFNNIECGVMYHSVDGSKIISVNQAALDILGYDSLDDAASCPYSPKQTADTAVRHSPASASHSGTVSGFLRLTNLRCMISTEV